MNGFQAPIPGQSLTTPPGSMPFERPPEINDPEEAIQMHLTRLNTAEMKQDILDMLELDVSVRQLTEGLLRSAVAEGIHSIDTSLVIAPVIHEFVRLTADKAGIPFDEGLVDKKEEDKKRKVITVAKAKKMLTQFMAEKPKDTPEAPSEEEIMVETPKPESTGFMKRRTV
jgi:hypothetical protein